MRRTAKWAGAAILAGTVLRVMFLCAKSLWFDEASTLLLAAQPLAGLTRILTSNEVNPPFYYALMHFWLKAFSDPRLGLRWHALAGTSRTRGRWLRAFSVSSAHEGRFPTDTRIAPMSERVPVHLPDAPDSPSRSPERP